MKMSQDVLYVLKMKKETYSCTRGCATGGHGIIVCAYKWGSKWDQNRLFDTNQHGFAELSDHPTPSDPKISELAQTLRHALWYTPIQSGLVTFYQDPIFPILTQATYDI